MTHTVGLHTKRNIIIAHDSYSQQKLSGFLHWSGMMKFSVSVHGHGMIIENIAPFKYIVTFNSSLKNDFSTYLKCAV